ncbi:HK97 gp10 family phage protein [Actinomadura miaoliensis]|uniref:HK97 gp10 family phage protein n=1 Tax=Actinomadura miaoliensis TaxID=430685 RepID=A0ABP7W729_9ACTN
MAQIRVTMTPGWQRLLRPRLRRAENRLAEMVAEDARRFVPIDSGELQSTIQARGNRVYVGTDYWHIVEFGSRPHTIYPRAKKALYWRGAAHPVHRVRHPGTPAQPFMRPALYRRRTPPDMA